MDDHDYDDVNSDENIQSEGASSDDDSDPEDDSPEDAYFKPTTALKLEKMASVCVAIALLKRATVVIPGMITNHDEWRKSLRKEASQWIFALPVPKSLAVRIKHCFYSLRCNVHRWISYIFGAVFLRRGDKSNLYQHIDRIIWYPNETINSAETARNLLKSDKLTDGEKFRLACTYCLREEIEEIWPTMEDDHITDELLFSEYPLTYYWKCYCADNLDNIQTPRNMSIYEFMITQPWVDNWPAIEYFFDRLDAEQQVTIAIWLIDEYKISFQNLLLMKLNESQRSQVISAKGGDILGNYAFDFTGDYVENVIKTWHDVRDFIIEEEFFTFLKKLLLRLPEDFLLMEIWNTARDDLKSCILESASPLFLKSLLMWFHISKKKGLRFVSSVLLNCTDVQTKREIRKTEFFTDCCIRFIYYNAVDLLNQVINLYYPKAAESKKFKLSLTKTSYFDDYCAALIISHQFHSFVKLLDFGFPKSDPKSAQRVRKVLNEHLSHLDEQCLSYYSTGNLKCLNDLLAPLASSYPEIISNYKRKLLMSRDGFKACVNHFGSTNVILAGIIADGLPSELTVEWKKKIIFSSEGIDKLQNMIDNGPLKDAEKCARWFLKSSADKKKFRTLLINRLKKEKSVQPETRKKYSKFLL